MWIFNRQSNKYHFYRDGLSLCKLWCEFKRPGCDDNLIEPESKCLTCERILNNGRRRRRDPGAAMAS